MTLARLSEVAELNPELPASVSDDCLVAFAPMASLSPEGQLSASERRPAGAVRRGYTPFVNGDVLVAKITPCFENNKIGEATIAEPAGFGSSEFHVVRCDRNRLHRRFLLHFLRQDRVRLEGQRRMTGSAGQRRVPLAWLAGLVVPLPPLAEQRRIADILDRADAMRAKRREAIALLDALPQALFSRMFGDPSLNRLGLPTERLSRLGTLDRGISKHRPRNAPELLGGPYPLVQTGDVASSGGYIRHWQSTYSEFGLRQSRLWPAGTLCITIAANIARAGILTFDSCFPDSVVGFSSDRATVEFVRVWLLFLQKALEDAAPESAQKNINLDLLRNLTLPVPSLRDRQEFAERVEAVERLKMTHKASLAELDALFASLQHRAFRGEL